ncbi:MAG: TRAP transporter small permease [candidate division NC10 bacterium]|nr:TRAP transporter small permease [candidate division NC10 bacterium]
MWNALSAVERGVEALVRWIVIVLMLVMTVTVFLQIVFRYVFNIPLGWSEEMARFSFVWVSFFGASALMRVREHVNVTVFVDNFPPRLRAVCVLVANLCALIFAYYFVVGGIALTTNEWAQLAPAMQIPMGWVYMVIPISAVLMAIWIMLQTIEAFGTLLGGARP